ncbi:ATP-binding protein [Hymenobacter profundi]|uniref:ATP-binding protein n=1 Tax=Hymenobacter profundi TaxID=1982110 RepID=UPI001FEBB98A|nr:ATP-binding protein [Hymenobacter profundi]
MLQQIERTLELLRTKYGKAHIRYEGANRIEEYTFPEAALREALLNALAHKDYSGGTPVQIRVHEDRIVFWNEGHLPDSWTVENLRHQHPSKPFNPDVANTLFRAGYIESWGRGTLKMIHECRVRQLPAPRYYFETSGMVVEFVRYTEAYLRTQGLRPELIPLVLYVQEHGVLTNSLVQQLTGLSKPTATRYLTELEKTGYLQKTGTRGTGTAYHLVGSV